MYLNRYILFCFRRFAKNVTSKNIMYKIFKRWNGKPTSGGNYSFRNIINPKKSRILWFLVFKRCFEPWSASFTWNSKSKAYRICFLSHLIFFLLFFFWRRGVFESLQILLYDVQFFERLLEQHINEVHYIYGCDTLLCF